MRVSNEDANTVIKNYEYYFDKAYIAMSESVTETYKYAADLLEARELIKEMREEIGAVVATESTPTTKGELVYISNFVEMRELLERTKECTE